MTTARPGQLLRRSPLLPGESLESLLARLAQRNHYPSGAVLELLCRERLPHPDRIAQPKRAETFLELADLVGLPIAELYAASPHRFAAVMRPPNSPAPMLQLSSGPPVPLLTRPFLASQIWPEATVQFCPYCLQEATYHRVAWLPVAVSVCLRHHCLLVQHCPRCGSSLRVPNLLEDSCPACGLALTEVHPISVAADERGLAGQKWIQSWLGLAPPSATLPASSWPILEPAILYGVLEGLRQTVMRVGPGWSFLASPPDNEELFPCRNRKELTPGKAYVLYATALRGLIDWPRGLYAFLNAYQRRDGRQPSGQVEEDLGYLYHSWIEGAWRKPDFLWVQEAIDSYLAQHFVLPVLLRLPRAKNRPAFRDSLPYTSTMTAAMELGTNTEMIHRLVQTGALVTYPQEEDSAGVELSGWVRRVELGVLQQQEFISLEQAALLLGATTPMTLNLVDAGLITAVRHLPAGGFPTWQLGYEALDDFLQRLQEVLWRPTMTSDLAICFPEAVQQLSVHGLNAASLLMGLFQGQVRGYWPAGENRLDELRIHRHDLARWGEQLASPRSLWSLPQVAAHMGVDQATVRAWVKRGLLASIKKRPQGLRFHRDLVNFLADEYVLSPKAAQMLVVSLPILRQLVQDQFLRPISGPSVDGLRHDLFRRQDVRQLVLQRQVEDL